MAYQYRVVSGRRFSYKDGAPQPGVPFAEFNQQLEGWVQEGWQVRGEMAVEADSDRVVLLLQRELKTGTPYRGEGS